MNFRIRRSRLILFALLAVTIVAGLLVYGSRSNEPVYRGYPLTRWVNSYEAVNGGGSQEARSERAVAAINSIGTNALPWMLSAIDHEPSRVREHFRTHSAKLPAWLSNSSFIQRLLTDNEEAASTAMRTFEILGPDAATAIPLLEQLARSTNKPNSATRAVIALGYIGRDAVPTITNLLADSRPAQGWAMQYCLNHLGTNAAPAIPILVDLLNNTNAAIADSSVLALGKFWFAADQCVHPLVSTLTNANSTVRRSAAIALSNFGARARFALPALTNALLDADPEVRQGAIFAIKTISLEPAK